MVIRVLWVFFTLFLLCNAGWLAFGEHTSDSTSSGDLGYSPGRLLVRLRSVPKAMAEELAQNRSASRTHIKSIDKLNQKYGVCAIEHLFENAEDSHLLSGSLYEQSNLARIFIFKVPTDVDVSKLAAEYGKNPMVEYAEPDYAGRGGGTVTPNDTRFPDQWALHNTGQTGGKVDADIDVLEAWGFTTGSNEVVIAVLDTGVDLNHPDLKPKIAAGFDCVNGDAHAQDDNGHGTSIAGIIGAETDNKEGIAGICWHCTFLPVKVLDAANFGFYSWWVKGIHFAVRENANIIVICMGGNQFSQTLKDTVDFAYDNGVLLISITHNFGNDEVYYPGGFENVIAVGATDMNDERWTNSSFGSHLDVVAPGVSIMSATKGGAYTRWTGTSQAAAHVAGLAALLLSFKPELTPAEVRAVIQRTAEDEVGLAAEDTPGWDRYYGHGRINAYSAIASMADIPTAVQLRRSLPARWGYIKALRRR